MVLIHNLESVPESAQISCHLLASVAGWRQTKGWQPILLWYRTRSSSHRWLSYFKFPW